MDTLEERLRQQAAIARAAHSSQKLRSIKGSERQNQHSVGLGYNASVGADEVRLADGSIVYAASNSNGSIGTGDALELHLTSSGSAHVDAMPHPLRLKPQAQAKEILKSPFKVLFSVFKDGITSFYIGGDRAQPTKILELPTEGIAAYLTNTGSGKNDWICGFTYLLPGEEVLRVKSLGANGHNWEMTSPLSNSCTYRGWGFWASEFLYAFSEKLSSSTTGSSTKSEYYRNNFTGEYYVISPGDTIPPNSEQISLISSSGSRITTDVYGLNGFLDVSEVINTGNEVIITSSSTVNKFDSLDDDYHHIPYGTDQVSNFVATKIINTITSSFDIYKGVINRYNGNFVETVNTNIAKSYSQQLDYETPYGWTQWAEFKLELESIDTTDTQSILGSIPILPGVQHNTGFTNTHAGGNSKKTSSYINRLEVKPEEYYNEEYSGYNNATQESESSNLYQVYVPFSGASTAYVMKSVSSLTYSDASGEISSSDQGFYLLNSTDSKLTGVEEITPPDFRTTNLVKNTFYVSPVETVEIDPVTGDEIRTPPKYINKDMSLSGNKYTVESSGAVTKTSFKDKIFSLKIKPTDNYALHGISYYPAK